jgi:hypothetical protein
MRFRSARIPLSPVSTTRRRLPLAASIKLALCGVAIAAAGACAGQGEGQLCNPNAGNAGNDDCQSGLTCVKRPSIVISTFGICCPPTGQATTTACSVNGSFTDASPEPPDAFTQAASADAQIEGAADAPGTDAGQAGLSADSAPLGSDAADATVAADVADATLAADMADAATE